jgi:hypothetical protein
MSRSRQKAQILDLDNDFAYPTTLLNSASTVVSPTKVTRTVSSTIPRKRKPKYTTGLEYDEEVVISPETASVLPEMDNADVVEQINLQELTAFEKYFDAVLSNCAGFFPVSKNIFVVQGWDMRKERATVSDQFSIPQYLRTS